MSRQGGGEGGATDSSLETGIAEVETREVCGIKKRLEITGGNWRRMDPGRQLYCWGKFVGPYSGRSGGRTTLKPGRLAKQSRSPNRNISDTTTKEHLQISAR